MSETAPCRHAVFRVDASPQIGAGHVTRCLALANSLARQGWRCTFASVSETWATAPQIERLPCNKYQLDASAWRTPEALAEAAATGCDLLVIDHYGLAEDYERPCRAWADSILVIDDLADRPHDCDSLLDPANDNGNRYDGLVPPGCRLLLGPNFALLASEFVQGREAALRMRGDFPVERVLIAFGATDPENFTEMALKAIAGQKGSIAVDIVLGPTAPYLDRIRALSTAAGHQLHIQTDDMAGLMLRADLAIGAAGVTAWERCCLALPGIAVVTAANQKKTAVRLSAAGAATVLDGTDVEASIKEALTALVVGTELRATMSNAAAALCDGRGAERVHLAIASPVVASGGAPVSLRPATGSDTERMLVWQSDPRTRRFSRNPDIPDRAAHQLWVAARLTDPDCLLNIVEHEGVPAGVVRLDRGTLNCGTRPAWEISIYVAPDRFGEGIGSAALALARHLVVDAEFVAEVLPENVTSHALFRKAGYVWRDDLYWQAPVEADGKGTP